MTRECFYCGSLLLDMVDNDVFAASSKDYEFYSISQEEASQIASFGEEDANSLLIFLIILFQLSQSMSPNLL